MNLIASFATIVVRNTFDNTYKYKIANVQINTKLLKKCNSNFRTNKICHKRTKNVFFVFQYKLDLVNQLKISLCFHTRMCYIHNGNDAS